MKKRAILKGDTFMAMLDGRSAKIKITKYYSGNCVIFHLLGLSVVSGTITDYNVQVAWTNTGIPQQIKEYFIFYKPVKEENQQIKNGWSFTRSPQPLATLTPLQPATEYSVFVLGYTSSGKVYGSNDVNFTTTGGIVD